MRMMLDIVPTGRTTATVILTQEQVDDLRGAAGRGRVPVAITYLDATFRTSVSVYRGQWVMVVNQAMRDGGLTPPGAYPVDIVMDASERTVEVPPDLVAALVTAGMAAGFEAASYTKRKEWVRGVNDAKKPETRAARIAKVVAALGPESGE